MVEVKKITNEKISPKMVNPKDLAGERRRRRRVGDMGIGAFFFSNRIMPELIELVF